ncbi:PHD finger protein rhinoceros-like [Montipora capricornis]|uniref:PHD finger protein rhinoceros-like n=1 Tax=Montipora capricornis TaxID=246305 RepID=UPI0035F1D57E
MGSKAKKDRKSGEYFDGDDELDLEKNCDNAAKSLDLKGFPNASIGDNINGSSQPPSPVSFSLEGRKPAEIFRTDLISAMKLPDHQNLTPENYMTISDSWRQEWERGVQVPVNPEGVFQPSFRPVEPLYKRTANFKLQSKLLVTPSKMRGRPPSSKCPYDLSRMDVEWLTALNKVRQKKGLIELEEAVLEKAVSYIENKCYDNMGHAIATQEGLSIEYDEDVCCDVCQSPDCEELNEMVFCDSCDICVHQACYGIQNIPAGSWLCHPCRKGMKTCYCILCNHSGGAMKRTKNCKSWVHVSCALWIPEVGFGNVSKMEPITRIENIPASRWNLVCSLCREKVGACIQCTVKSCVTAFHVTCGFKHGLEMRTVLDDSAADGVRHISYCTKHSHKSKSPSKRTKEDNTTTSSEDAENLRQKRLKQMEDEFYKFVSIADIAKDLNLPKELAARIHKYWTLKRKVQDDIPLLPPSLQQQEKLSGKQGAADSSRNLQAQLERIVKLRCNLEKLRNLCYMVTKREKMRRELYRAREEVFWKEYEMLTDDTCKMDEKAIQGVLAMCKDNFIGDSNLTWAASATESCDSIPGSLASRVSSTVDLSNTMSNAGDCSSTEQDTVEDSISHTLRGTAEAFDKSETNIEEAAESSKARRTRRNSHAVSGASPFAISMNLIPGCSKEPDSVENSDSEVFIRKRTRVKSQSSCESSGKKPRRLLRNTMTEMEDEAPVFISLKPQTRKRRHVSLPDVLTTKVKEIDKEGSVPSEEDFQNADLVSRETRSQTSRGSKNIDAEETRSSSKREVDEKESRKENNPLRLENMLENQTSGTETAKVTGKRKRSQNAINHDNNNNNKQARITELMRRKSKSSRLRGNKSSSDSEDSDETEPESCVDALKGFPSKSFSNRDKSMHSSLCPNGKTHHDRLSQCERSSKDERHTVECADNWNRRELRLRSFQSPKSRGRCSHVVTPKPHCCSSLMSKFCHATVT